MKLSNELIIRWFRFYEFREASLCDIIDGPHCLLKWDTPIFVIRSVMGLFSFCNGLCILTWPMPIGEISNCTDLFTHLSRVIEAVKSTLSPYGIFLQTEVSLTKSSAHLLLNDTSISLGRFCAWTCTVPTNFLYVVSEKVKK